MNSRVCPKCDRKVYRAGNLSMLFTTIDAPRHTPTVLGNRRTLKALSWNEVFACNHCKLYFELEITDQELEPYRNIIRNFTTLQDAKIF